jgi:hypothetical protein
MKYENLNPENIIVYSKNDYLITEQQAIRKALSMVSNIPVNAYLKPLVPIAMYRFNGSNNKILNEQFETGKEYPAYAYDTLKLFVVGKNGSGRLMKTGEWNYIKTL